MIEDLKEKTSPRSPCISQSEQRRQTGESIVMAESEKKPCLKFAKRRTWTKTETQDAISYIQSSAPDLWREVEQTEKTTGEFTDTVAAEDQYRLLIRLHPECEPTEITDLYIAMRKFRRKAWGV